MGSLILTILGKLGKLSYFNWVWENLQCEDNPGVFMKCEDNPGVRAFTLNLQESLYTLFGFFEIQDLPDWYGWKLQVIRCLVLILS